MRQVSFQEPLQGKLNNVNNDIKKNFPYMYGAGSYCRIYPRSPSVAPVDWKDCSPLFLFSFVHGMDYTRNQKNFIKQLYIFNVITSVLMFAFNQTPQHRAMFDTITANILGTFTAIYFLIRTIEKVRKRKGAWKRTLAVYVLCQIISTTVYLVIALNCSSRYYALECVIAQLSGNVFLTKEDCSGCCWGL